MLAVFREKLKSTGKYGGGEQKMKDYESRNACRTHKERKRKKTNRTNQHEYNTALYSNIRKTPPQTAAAVVAKTI